VDLEDLRLAVYRTFVTTGRAPTTVKLSAELDVSAAQVALGLNDLAAQRHVVLDDGGAIVMAHPFSAVPLGFSVMGRATLWWGGCAWDSFALPHLLHDEHDVLVATRCPGCDCAGSWVVGRDRAPVSEWVAHFLVPVAHMWGDVVHTCAHQRLFCSEDCIADWLTRHGKQRGYVMSVETLWRLARGWYEGRLERGYVRREPSAAADYLRSVGLDGPFWGL
jgi:hypothetical protein